MLGLHTRSMQHTRWRHALHRVRLTCLQQLSCRLVSLNMAACPQELDDKKRELAAIQSGAEPLEDACRETKTVDEWVREIEKGPSKAKKRKPKKKKAPSASPPGGCCSCSVLQGAEQADAVTSRACAWQQQ